MAEVMCGKGALLSQIIASIRPTGANEIGLHADQNWFPAPFPIHNQLFTVCWALDDFTKKGGCTKVIPGSHKKRRHPLPDEIVEQKGAIPIECSSGSLAMWDGSVWHSNYPRKIEGDRVVIHITFCRLALRPVESYDHLDEEWLKDKPKELSTLLGRDDFLGHKDFKKGGAGGEVEKLVKTFTWARS
jgi:ectoine hydroxylase-related dioxygenase (phytanoyl-CoA dioxygenase family)